MLGRALQLQVHTPAAQAAAVQSAWQLHSCRVIVLNRLSSEAMPAVQASLAAGVSVVAAAEGFADLAALHGARTEGLTAGTVSSSSSGVSAAAALWELLRKQSSESGSSQRCCIVECVPGYR